MNKDKVKVPITIRDCFFDDPFFKSSWDDFDIIKENMFHESRKMWKRFEEKFGDVEQMNMWPSSQNNEPTGIEQSIERRNTDKDYFGWLLPRRWLMPSLFNNIELIILKCWQHIPC